MSTLVFTERFWGISLHFGCVDFKLGFRIRPGKTSYQIDSPETIEQQEETEKEEKMNTLRILGNDEAVQLREEFDARHKLLFSEYRAKCKALNDEYMVARRHCYEKYCAPKEEQSEQTG